MLFKNLYVLVLWTEVAFALEALRLKNVFHPDRFHCIFEFILYFIFMR